MTGKIFPDFYVHTMDTDFIGTQLSVEETDGIKVVGNPVEEYEPADYKGETVVKGDYVLRQDLEIDGDNVFVNGTVTWSACSGDECRMPEDYDFSVGIPGRAGNDAVVAGNGNVISGNDALGAAVNGKGSSGTGSAKGLWGLILEAILWGFLMLLTPCVFPMVPMTVS
ncbi:MAG: hypothetical protein J6W07_05675, partial [Bacteroidales bacterium]|nr:hypothetical protein [Bacteroidales bacterium]